MTKEGRLAWHKSMLKQGKPSPYADEFKEDIFIPSPEITVAEPVLPEEPKTKKKKKEEK